MELHNLYSGIIIGLVAASPVGAVAILCMQKTLQKGFLHGWLMGVGSAFGDFFYAIIACFGLSYISDFLVSNRLVLGILGGILMIALGFKIFRGDPVKQWRQQKAAREGLVKNKKKNIWADFTASFVLTISNPFTVIMFGGLFTASGTISDASSKLNTYILLIGVISGAIIWWSILVSVVNIFRNKIGPRIILWINRIMGSLIMIFGIAVMITVLFFNDKL